MMHSPQVDPRQEEELRILLQVVSRLFECPTSGYNDDHVLETYLDCLPDIQVGDPLRHFWNARQQFSTDELWQLYVDTFELQENQTLYLTSRLFVTHLERESALLRLSEAYHRIEFSAQLRESPDYLPSVFEFAAVAPMYEAAAVFVELRPAIVRLERILRELGSLYADVAKASLTLSERVISRGGGAYLLHQTGLLQ